MRFLLDTNVVSEAAKPRPNAKCLNWLQAHSAASGYPSLALAERYQGAFALAEPERQAMLDELQAVAAEAGESLLPFDAKSAKAWGDYVNHPKVKSQPPGVIDSLIAAIAIANGLTVATRDTDHFPEVDVINPFD